MPSTVQPYVLRGLKGRNGSAPENINDKEFQTLQNWYSRDGALRRRYGTSRVSGINYSTTLTGCSVYLPLGKNYKVMLGAENAICKLESSAIVALSVTTSAIPTSTNLWFMQQYKSSMYLLRKDIGLMYRSDGSSVNNSGIAAPTAAPTIAVGASADLAAGDYEAVYTYFNSITGAESNPSPASSQLTVSANDSIDWSAVTISTSPQVNARKLYRSLIGQQGEYFHVRTVGDNTTTTSSAESALLADMGLPVETTNGAPPSSLTMMAIHQERMWLSDGQVIYFSELGLPESFKSSSDLSVQSDDGYNIMGLTSFGQILLVLKQKGIYFVSGSDESSFSVRVLHDTHGCVSPHSVAVAENFAFWFGGDNFYLSDGSKVAAIGNTEVIDIIQNISSDDYDLIQGTTYPKDGLYMVGIPVSGVITSWLAYNYRTGDWHTMTFDAAVGTPTFIELVPDANGEPVLYGPFSAAAHSGQIFRFMDPTEGDDFGSVIECIFHSKNYGFQTEDSMKFMKEIQFLMSTTGAAEDITVELWRDDESAREKTISVNTFGKKLWKRIPIANNDVPGNFLSLRCVYSGDADFTILGLGFKIVDLGRQVPTGGA